jgi:hypothetical protein
VVHDCSPGYSGGKSRRISIWDQPVQRQETLSKKQTKSKRTRGMVPVVECLLSNMDALKSILSITKRKRKELCLAH